MKRKLISLALIIASAVFGCSKGVRLEIKADLTGDGIEDIIAKDGYDETKYLFIGQEDGSYVRAREHVENSGVRYYQTKDKRFYFFDGKKYVEAKKFPENFLKENIGEKDGN